MGVVGGLLVNQKLQNVCGSDCSDLDTRKRRRLAGAKVSINQWQAFNRNRTAFLRSIMINESEPAVSERCADHKHTHVLGERAGR